MANAIKSENAALRTGGSISTDLTKLSGLYSAIVTSRVQLQSRFEGLKAPKQGAPESYLRARVAATNALEQVSKTLKQAAGAPTAEAVAARTKDTKAANATAKRSRTLARAYGFESCEAPLKG